MNYSRKIKELELQYESLTLRTKNPLPEDNISELNNQLANINEQLSNLRRKVYESQYSENLLMNMDNYDY